MISARGEKEVGGPQSEAQLESLLVVGLARRRNRRRLGLDLASLAIVYAGLVIFASVANSYTLLTDTQYVVPVMMAVGLAMMWGTAGVLSFGQSLLYGVGGYAYGIIGIQLAHGGGVSGSDLAFIGGIVVPTVSAFGVGWVMFYSRLSRIYVAIVMFVLSIAANSFMDQTAGQQWRIGRVYLGGNNGLGRFSAVIQNPPSLDLGFGGAHVGLPSGSPGLFIFVSGIAIAVLALGRAMALSRRALILRSLRENEAVTESLGYDTRRARLLMFTLGGCLAGLSGVLFVAWGTFITPDVFSVTAAIMPVVWVTIAGAESIVAVAVVTVALSWLTVLFAAQGNLTYVIIGGVLVVVSVLAPRGSGPTIAAVVRRGRKGRLSAPGGVARHSLQGSSRDEPERSQWGSSALGEGVGAPDAGLNEVPIVTREGTPQSAPGGPPRLRVVGVRKSWGGVGALRGIDLTVDRGEIVCIIGPNGSGKTTLLKCISGDIKPNAGRIELDGVACGAGRLARARQGISIKYQNGGSFPGLSVRENLALASGSPGGDSRVCTRKVGGTRAYLHAEELLPRAVRSLLGAKGDSRLGELPHGEQQLVEIGMAIAQEPRLLILDEPAAGLSPSETESLASLVREVLARFDVGVIVTEHDMRFVQRLESKVVVLHRGQVLARGTYDEMVSREDVKRVYLGTGQDPSDSKEDGLSGQERMRWLS